MKTSSFVKLFAVVAFLAFGASAFAGGACCPSGGKDKEKEASTEESTAS